MRLSYTYNISFDVKITFKPKFKQLLISKQYRVKYLTHRCRLYLAHYRQVPLLCRCLFIFIYLRTQVLQTVISHIPYAHCSLNLISSIFFKVWVTDATQVEMEIMMRNESQVQCPKVHKSSMTTHSRFLRHHSVTSALTTPRCINKTSAEWITVWPTHAIFVTTIRDQRTQGLYCQTSKISLKTRTTQIHLQLSCQHFLLQNCSS